ncbi:maleylacetate reductase [Streptomyces sp. NPDC088785]|uniref:maleylacetate reductase n=1 Tax=Streptomyces sp. NPDC088785 TaxID=3365897 RepID=UPI0038140B86
MAHHPDHPPSPSPVTVHETLSARVLIGTGSRHTVPGECARLGARRVLLVSTPSAARIADELADALGPVLAARFDRPAVHTPVEVTAEALRLAERAGADSVVALGGGSAIGLAKALSVRTGIPQIAVPTTYAGSEATPVLGETENGVKTTRRAPGIAPGTIVYDPEPTLTLPPGLTLTSALNALAHAVEALWAPDANPLSDALASEAADGLLATLPLVLGEPTHPGHRARLQTSAWLAGLCLAGTSMGLHHRLAHALGGTYDLPHAPLHALLLPHVMAFNLPSAPRAATRLVRATGGADPVAAVAGLARSHDGPTTLAALGAPREGLRTIAERVAAALPPHPRPVGADSLTRLLEEAF